MPEVRRDATAGEARALAHPVRLRILRLLRFERLTNAEMARRLAVRPATTLHHVRTLLRAGFIEQVGERAGPNGITEKLYRDTTKSWTLNIAEEHDRGSVGSAALGAFVAEITAADSELQSVVRQALKINANSLNELTHRLIAVFDDFEDRQDPDGAPYAVFLAIHRSSTSTAVGRSEHS